MELQSQIRCDCSKVSSAKCAAVLVIYVLLRAKQYKNYTDICCRTNTLVTRCMGQRNRHEAFT
jgi:hypothetical protein